MDEKIKSTREGLLHSFFFLDFNGFGNPTWSQVGPIWGLLGPLWGALEAAEADRKQKAGKPTHIDKHKSFNDFRLSGASLASSVAASGRLVAVWAPLGLMLETV